MLDKYKSYKIIVFFCLLVVFISCNREYDYEDEVIRIVEKNVSLFLEKNDFANKPFEKGYFNNLKILEKNIEKRLLKSTDKKGYAELLSDLEKDSLKKEEFLSQRNDIFLLGFFDRTALFFVVYKESIIEYLKTKENSKLKNKELFNYYLSFANFGIEFNELSKLGDIIDYDSEYQRLSYLDLISRFYNIPAR